MRSLRRRKRPSVAATRPRGRNAILSSNRATAPGLRTVGGACRSRIRATRSGESGIADSRTMRRLACDEASAPQLKRIQVAASTSVPLPSMKSATHSASSRRKIATSRRSLRRSIWPWMEVANPASESVFNGPPFERTCATPTRRAAVCFAGFARHTWLSARRFAMLGNLGSDLPSGHRRSRERTLQKR